MNSFRTEPSSRRALAAYPDLALPGLPLGFRQHQVPRLDAETLMPVSEHTRPDLAWCPPGHGDLYTALLTTGLLSLLLDLGFEYVFVSNADNLGAVIEPAVLGHMARTGLDMVMEAADRTNSDRKGGHLCRLLDGRLALRELAQCPPEELDEFQDVERFRFFNTNSLWFRLRAVDELLRSHDGVLPLPTIVNRKPIDPRDPASRPVVQLETAMGAAIELFPRAAAVRVPRTRFSPVKTCDDLLAVRSDAYLLTDDARLVLVGERSRPPEVRLDPRFYRTVADLDTRFPAGPPSLRRSDSLEVTGDVTFGSHVTIEGAAQVCAADGRRARIPDGAVLAGRTDL